MEIFYIYIILYRYENNKSPRHEKKHKCRAEQTRQKVLIIVKSFCLRKNGEKMTEGVFEKEQRTNLKSELPY